MGSKKAFRGAMLFAAGSLAGKSLFFLFQLVAARLLSPEEYGLYATVNGLFLTIAWIVLCGLQVSILRLIQDCHGDDQCRGELYGSSLAFVLVSSMIGGFVFIVFTNKVLDNHVMINGLSILVLCFALSVPFITISRLAAVFFQADRILGEAAIILDVGRVLLLILLTTLFYVSGEKNLQGIAYGMLTASSLICAYAVTCARKKLHFGIGQFSFAALQKLFRYSMPIFLSGLGFYIFNQYDRIIVVRMFPPAVVGSYNAAVTIAGQAFFIMAAFNSALMPEIANLSSRGLREELGKFIATTSKGYFLFLFPQFLLILLFPVEIMRITFGAAYVDGASVLSICGGAWLLYYMKGPSGGYLLMCGQQHLEAANTYIGLCVAIAVSFLCAPEFGPAGIAAGIAAGVLLIGLLEIVEVYWISGYSPMDWLDGRVFFVAASYAASAAMVVGGLSKLWFLVVLLTYPIVVFKYCLTANEKNALRSLTLRTYRKGRELN